MMVISLGIFVFAVLTVTNVLQILLLLDCIY